MSLLRMEEEMQDKTTEGVVPGVSSYPFDRSTACRSKGSKIFIVE